MKTVKVLYKTSMPNISEIKVFQIYPSYLNNKYPNDVELMGILYQNDRNFESFEYVENNSKEK